MEKDLLQAVESNFVTRKALRDPFQYSSLVTNGEVYMELNASLNDIAPKTHYLCLQNYVLCSMCTSLSKQMQSRETKPKTKVKERNVSSFVQDHLDEYILFTVSKDSCIQHYHSPPLEATPRAIELSSVSSSLQDILQETEVRCTLLFPDNNPKVQSVPYPNKEWSGLEQCIKPFEILYDYDQPEEPHPPIVIENPTLKRVQPIERKRPRRVGNKRKVGLRRGVESRFGCNFTILLLSSSPRMENS